MKKRILSLLLALAMCLTMLPSASFATEEQPQTSGETVEVFTETCIPETDLPSSDELFAGYVEQLFSPWGGAGIYSTGSRTAGSQLTGDEKLAYDALVPVIKAIAAGERASAVISMGQTVNGNVVPEISVTFTDSWDQFDTKAIINALLADFPYEMYWFDKTLESLVLYYQAAPLPYACFYFDVVPDYNDGVEVDGFCNTADTAKTGAASKAVAAAQKVVSDNASLSDYDKLVAYRDYICNSVSYNENAASSTWTGGYGDPWQLIHVFDGDSSTNVVCEGYAKAFQYLCDLSDFTGNVQCYTVTGQMSGGTGAGGHMWNIVTMEDGKNYLVDVTNSDFGTVGQDGELFLTGGMPISSGSLYGYTVNGVNFYYDSDLVWGDDVTTLASSNYEPSTEPALTKLDAPTDLRWHSRNMEEDYGGWISFDGAENTVYQIKYWQKGNDTPLATWINETWAAHTDSFTPDIFPDGTGIYYFTVQAIGDGETTANSDIATSEEWTYTKPATVLNVSNITVDADNWTVTWTNDFTDLSLVDRIPIRLDYLGADGNDAPKFVKYFFADNTWTNAVIPADYMAENGEGYYQLTLQVCTADIRKALSSDEMDIGTVYLKEKELTKLDAPTDLRWNSWPYTTGVEEDWEGNVSYTGLPNELYHVNFYRKTADGDVLVDKMTWHMGSDTRGVGVFDPRLFAEGTHSYYFTVQANGNEDTTIDSDLVTSDVWEYTKPEILLDVSNIRIDADSLTVSWDNEFTANEYVDRIAVNLYYGESEDSVNQRYPRCFWAYDGRMNGYDGTTSARIPAAYLNEIGNAYYRAEITVYTGDIRAALTGGDEMSETVWLEMPELTKLAEPYDLAWNTRAYSTGYEENFGGYVSFRGIQDERYRVQFWQKKDDGDDLLLDTQVWLMNLRPTSTATFDPSEFPDDTGTYYFTVQAIGDNETKLSSDIVKSEEWTYTKPTVVLDFSNVIVEETPNTISWTNLFTDLSLVGRISVWMEHLESGQMAYFDHYNGGLSSVTLPNSHISVGGSGYYKLTIRMHTADITTALSGNVIILDRVWLEMPTLTKLAAPTDLRWNSYAMSDDSIRDDFTGFISYTRAQDARHRVEFWQKKEDGDVKIYSANWSAGGNLYSNATFNTAIFPDGTGTYYFTVQALGDNETTLNSEIAVSDVWTYTKPSTVLNIKNVAVDTETGIISWTNDFADASLVESFLLRMYYLGKDGTESPQIVRSFTTGGNVTTASILASYLERKGEGYYRITIEPNSADIRQACDGEMVVIDKVYLSKVKLTPPTDLVWRKRYDWGGALVDVPMLFGVGYKGEAQTYRGELYQIVNGKDVPVPGAEIKSTSSGIMNWDPSVLPEGTGTYYVAITAVGDGVMSFDSETVKSPTFTYTKPATLAIEDVKVDAEAYTVTWKNLFTDTTGLNNIAVRFDFLGTDGTQEAQWVQTVAANEDMVSADIPMDITEKYGEGCYKLTIYIHTKDITLALGSTYIVSNVYLKPFEVTQIPAPTGLVWKGDILHWTLPESAYIGSVEVDKYFAKSATAQPEWIASASELPADTDSCGVGSAYIERYGDGYYYVTVRVVSSDPTRAADSEWSLMSVPYIVKTEKTETVKNSLEEIAKNVSGQTVEQIQEAIQQIGNLAEAVKEDLADGTLMDQISELEKAIEEKVTAEVVVSAEIEDETLQNLFSNAQLTGATLNAAEDTKTVSLKVAPATEEVEIPEELNNSGNNVVTFSMKLEGGVNEDAEAGQKLAVPMKITLPVPENINPASLVILHYHADNETYDEIRPYVYQKDGQWYASFIVTSFSNFVLIDEAPVPARAQRTVDGVLVSMELTTQDTSAHVMVAVYDKNGRMLGLESAALANGQNSVTVKCDAAQAESVKIFLLDGTHKPINVATEVGV